MQEQVRISDRVRNHAVPCIDGFHLRVVEPVQTMKVWMLPNQHPMRRWTLLTRYGNENMEGRILR